MTYESPSLTETNLFTAQQARILESLAAGETDKEIAAVLSISEETVAYHLRVMFERHHVHSRAGLVGVFVRALSKGGRVS